MSPRFPVALFRRLPPIARRDRRIRDLDKKLKRARSRPPSTEPSYRVMVHAERRMRGAGRAFPSVITHGKFYVQDVVRSHGIDVPEQFGRWDDPRQIAWDELPDRVVIKSMRGFSAQGVLPIRRGDGGWQIISHGDDVLTGDQLAELLIAQVDAGNISGPFGAEEFLDQDGTGTRPPVDVKLYTFYGETVIVLLRQVEAHGDPTAVFRIVDRHGQDAGDHYSGKPIDPTLEVPTRLTEMVDAAERLSIAIRAPFSRIDMYGIGERIVFGEITPRPGGPQWFGPELDARLGAAWEQAHVRLWRDIKDGMLHDPEWGPFLRGHVEDGSAR